jgi:hypothetical protein
MEFPNQTPDVGCGIRESNPKDPLWNLRTEANRVLLWNSRTPQPRDWFWILGTEEATALLWNSRTSNPEVGCGVQEVGSPEIGFGFQELKRLRHCCGIHESRPTEIGRRIHER